MEGADDSRDTLDDNLVPYTMSCDIGQNVEHDNDLMNAKANAVLKASLEHEPKFNHYKFDKIEALPEMGRIDLLKLIHSFYTMQYS